MSWGVGEGKERKRKSEEREKSEQKKKKQQHMGKISYRFFHSLIEIWECRDLDPTGYPK